MALGLRGFRVETPLPFFSSMNWQENERRKMAEPNLESASINKKNERRKMAAQKSGVKYMFKRKESQQSSTPNEKTLHQLTPEPRS